MPPQSSQEIGRLRVRLTVAENKRNPMMGTINHLRSEQAIRSGQITSFRTQIRQKALEAEYAVKVEDRNRKEGLIAEMDWQVSRLSSEWEELGVRIENTEKDLRDLDQEISGLSRLLNGASAANWNLAPWEWERRGVSREGGCGWEEQQGMPGEGEGVKGYWKKGYGISMSREVDLADR